MKDLRNTRTMSIALFGLGVVLFLSPWLLGFSGQRAAMLSACGIGGLSALIAAASAFQVKDWWAAVSLSLGAWAVAAPALFGFVDLFAPASVHIGAGLATMTLAVLAQDSRTRRPPLSRA